MGVHVLKEIFFLFFFSSSELGLRPGEVRVIVFRNVNGLLFSYDKAFSVSGIQHSRTGGDVK